MPYTPIPDQTVNGAWGAGAYPPWFEQIAASKGMGNGAAKAAAFKNYVTANPTYDFGEYWNQFRPGEPLANHQFYNPANGDPPADEPDPNNPPPNDPNTYDPNSHTTTGNNPLNAGGTSVTSARPTTPGGPLPGRWQRLVSFRNGVRQERWEWRQDPVAPSTQTPPIVDPNSQKDIPTTGGEIPQTPVVSGVPTTSPGGHQGVTQQQSQPVQQAHSPVANAFGATIGQSQQPQKPKFQRAMPVKPKIGYSTIPQNPNLGQGV